MKRFFAAILFFVIALSFCSGCESSPKTESYQDENGNLVIAKDSGTTVMPESLPFEILYNGKPVTFESVDFFQDRSESDYRYTLYAILTVDVSQLAEDEQHWLEDSDMDAHIYLTNEQNDYDFDSLNYLGNAMTDDNKLVFGFMTLSSYKEDRYTYEGSKVSAVISITQEETYEYKYNGETKIRNIEDSLHFSTEVGTHLPDSEAIPEPIYSYMVQWINNKADFWRNKNT